MSQAVLNAVSLIGPLHLMTDTPDYWMFGGIWQVHGTEDRDDGRKYYNVELDDDLRSVIGRLI